MRPAVDHVSTSQNGGPEAGFQSGAALFTFDASKRILSWNKAAEEDTGIAADDVVGRYCWEVLCGHDEAGGIVCHADCSFHRLLCERWPVAPPTLTIRTATGNRRVRLPMITVADRALFAALIIDAGDAAAPAPAPEQTAHHPALTPRQQTVLAMLADGKQARKIAAELQLSEMTVRNHIRAILRELGCSSQLSAVAKARRLGLV
jgi:DNA-binding CsgD family transcriptional regulator